MSHKLRELIAEHEERVQSERLRTVQVARETELVMKELPGYWAVLRGAIQQDCERDTNGKLRFTPTSPDHEIRVFSEVGWLELVILVEPQARDITARCTTSHLRIPETCLWTKSFKGVYYDGSVSMAPAEQESAGSVVLHSPTGLSEELLCALIRSA